MCSNLQAAGKVRLEHVAGVGLVADVEGRDPLELEGLEDGLSPAASLARGNFDSIRPYPAAHVQMLAKVRLLESCCENQGGGMTYSLAYAFEHSSVVPPDLPHKLEIRGAE